jgi:hypothetical protein
MDIDKGYLGNVKLKRTSTLIQYTQDQLDEIEKCIDDPVYFIKTYVKIVNVDRGLVPFEMWPFQEEMVHSFHNERFTIAKMPRQVGKTTTAAGYMLHSVLFNDNYSIAILANKGALAREILDRIKYAYEYLPAWLQQGIVTWNKGNIELENGSKIAAFATSSSGVRGGSYNLIFLDEFAFVPQNMANEFFTSTYPVISSGKTTKVIIVSTPYGLNHFYKMWMDATEKRSDYNPIEVHWSMVPGRDEAWKEQTVRNTSEEQFSQEFETNFLGSTSTLISGSKLRSLVFGNPIMSYDDLDVYEEPTSNSSYVLTVDCAEGLDLDYSIIQVVDVTSIPYKQVAKYRNNRVAPLVFPNIIYSIGRKYNDAFILVETNSVGQQVVDILHYDLEYENIFRLESHVIKGQSISSGFKRSAGFGIKTTKSVKKVGCANLKAMIENDKITLTDFDTISELNTFTRDRDTYKAEEGNHDDLCMGLVLFAWLTAQSFFKEYTSTDIRQQLLDHTNTIIEDSLSPVGIFDGNYEDESEKFVDSDGDAWSVVKERGYLPSNF